MFILITLNRVIRGKSYVFVLALTVAPSFSKRSKWVTIDDGKSFNTIVLLLMCCYRLSPGS